ncbi:MAG: CtsR family transcriptional regulator, partial [Gudongella sp.]|nr:CtsR family transcriptional regulator [Gudongella sp.]
ESRRGGGGYIKIVKVELQNDLAIKNILKNILGDSITENKANEIIEALREEEMITSREAEVVRAAVSDRAFDCQPTLKNTLRASVLRNILLVLID